MKNQLFERLSQVKLYATEKMKTKEVLVTAVVPTTRWKWHIVESEPQKDGDWLLFAYCESGLGSECSEWGYVMLSDLIQVGAFFYERKNTQITLEGKVVI